MATREEKRAIARRNRYGPPKPPTNPVCRRVEVVWENLPPPKVRLARIRIVSWRIIEIIRFMAGLGGTSKINDAMAVELARRGVLDPMTHIITDTAHMRPRVPTVAARQLIKSALVEAISLGLIKEYSRNGKTLKGLFVVTPDGLSTLRDWDDPKADGLYGGGYVDDIGIDRQRT